MFRRNLMNNSGGGGVLPAEYQRVEYIQGDGASYFNTLYYPSSKTSVKANVFFTYIRTQCWFGCQTSINNPAFKGYSLQSGNYRFGNTTDSLQQENNILYSFEMNNEFVKNQNGIVYWNTSVFSSFGFSLYLFANNNSGNIVQICENAQIHSFQILENDSLKMNLIPCYRKSDSKPGMYDTVNGVFYTNQGTGEFVVGSDIN